MFVLIILGCSFAMSVGVLIYAIFQAKNIKKRPPKEFNPTYFLSDFSKNHRMNPIRSVMKYFFQAPAGSIITFSGGRPNNSTLPFTGITIKTKYGFEFSLEGAELYEALQYGMSAGPEKLRDWLRNFMERKDGKFPECTDITMGQGSNQLIIDVLDMVYIPGDIIACANPLFCAVPQWSFANNVALTPVSINSEGLDVEELKDLCERTPIKILYVVPNGSNPSGITMSETCRRAVYALAERYNFLIMEDDPYRFATGLESKPLPSFLHLDFQSSNPGRVIRLDSFSKILSPGIRLGWMTGHKVFIERMQRQIETRMLSPSYLDMMIVWKFLATHPNFDEHLQSVSDFYASNKKAMVRSLKKHFAPHGATWFEPKGGFFIWVDLSKTCFESTVEDYVKHMVDGGVIGLPGSGFSTDGAGFEQVLRLSFSEATTEEIEKGIPRLAEVFFGNKL